MRKPAKPSPLFARYLLIYFLAAFLPTFVMSSAVFSLFDTLEREAEQSNQMSVNIIQKTIDTKILEMMDLIPRIQANPDLTQYALTHSPVQAIQSLQQYSQTQDLLKDIIISIRGEKYFYSNKGTFPLEEVNLFYNFTNWTEDEWYQILSQADQPVLQYINGQYASYLFLFSPVYSAFQYNNQSPRIVAMAISNDKIMEFFKSSQTSYSENILMLDQNLDLLSFLNPVENSVLEQIQQFCAHSPDISSSQNILLAGEENMVFISHSKETGLYYIRLLPKKVAFKAVIKVRMITCVVMGLVLILGVIIIFVGMFRNYKPIRDLAVSVKNTLPENCGKQKSTDELTMLKNAFSEILQVNKFLSGNSNDSRKAIKEHFLMSLIKSSFVTEETFANTCRNLGITFAGRWFTVCSVLIEKGSEEGADIYRINTSIRENIPPDFQIQIMDLLIAHRLLLVICSDCADTKLYREMLQGMKERLLYQESLLVSIGMGNFHNSYDQIGKSYLESVNALDYRMIFGKDCIITPDMIPLYPMESSYPHKEIEVFQNALHNRNAAAMEHAVDQLTSFIKSSGCSLHVAKYICYDVLALFKKSLFLLEPAYTRHLTQTLDITGLVSFDTIDDFFSSLSEIGRTMFRKQENLQNSADPLPVGQKMIDYIHTNCFDYHFQINTMAEYFCISPQYMRKLFKSHTGTSISNYVMELKLQKTMELLTQTDDNLNEIVEKIGNVDVSGFIRLFKQKTGVTPGQYRTEHKKSNFK